MKKFTVSMLIILVCVLVASCVFDRVHYCPYCKSTNIIELEANVYKCDKCTKTFGAIKR